MALFGEKCHRCGQRTRHKEDDQAICENCVQEMHLMVDAAEEAIRTCPKDGATMRKEVAHMLVIDRCPECAGVWLDGGELERLKQGFENDAVMLMARGMTYPV